MPSFDAFHPQYKKMVVSWQKARDCYEGEDAIKARGQTYVPALSGQENNAVEYNKYISRGLFYGATYKTVRALVGAVMRKDPKVVVPKKLEPFVDDATSTGVSLKEFVKQVCGEVFLTARGGILVDRRSDGLPYLNFYNAENIINWGSGEGYTFVMLQEVIYVADPADPYTMTEQKQYKEVRTEGETVKVILHKRVATTKGGTEDWSSEEIIPQTRTGGLKLFPFVFVSPDSKANKVEKPVLMDLINVNLSHWRNSVDLEVGRHVLGLPTPYMTGVDPTDVTAVPLGPGHCVKLREPNSKFGFAEFTGAGLLELREALREKEDLMASLGARMLAAPPKGVESAETARIHESGENNTLISLVNGVEEAVEAVLEIVKSWEGISDETEYEMSRDFLNMKIDPATLKELFAVYQGNGISLESFLWNLKEGETLPPGRSIEDEAVLIKKRQEENQATFGSPQDALDALQRRQTGKPGTKQDLPKGGDPKDPKAQDLKTKD